MTGEGCTSRASSGSGAGRSVDGMQNKDEVKDFLTSRRAKVSPEQVELPGGTNRRVPGLRRTEVAMLAGVSVEY